MKIHTGDTVVIISGKDKGKSGTVLRVLHERNHVVVTGINMRTRHVKKTFQQAGRILKYEASMNASKVMLLDPKTKKPTRIGMAMKDGKNREDLLEDGRFNPFSIIDIDTVLISSRHMFRAPYSFHEKSGLISIPINKDNILNFNKEDAKPENVSFNEKFLSECSDGEASKLIIQAFDWNKKLPQRDIKIQKQYPDITQKISMELFPHSIKKGLMGIEDGRKRFLFVLLNFLRSLNYDYDEIEKIIEEWNKKNREPLKEGYIRSQIMWHKRQNKVLPPNYSNKAYYDDIGLKPQENELKFKNPVNYSLSLFRSKLH